MLYIQTNKLDHQLMEYKDKKKTIALPIEIHQISLTLAKKVGLKHYELICAAIQLASTDEKFLQAIVETHAKKFRFNGLDPKVRAKLEALSVEDLDALLEKLRNL